MYPMEKYHYYVDSKNNVYAASTFAGKTVKGVAKCDPKDEFSLEKGKELAALRCAEKIAKKRFDRAKQKIQEASSLRIDAEAHLDKMIDYYDNATAELNRIRRAKNSLLETL